MTNESTRFDDFLNDLRDKLKAEYEASEELKAEFPSADVYAAFYLNTAAAKPLVRRWREDFADTDNLAAFRAAQAAGRT